MSRRGTLRVVVMGIVIATVSVLGPAIVPADAHSRLVSSDPVDGAILDAPPAAVSFTFDEPLLPGTDTISVNDDRGNVISSISVEPVGSTISMPWPQQASTGMFQVAYRAVSGDGHPVSGAIMVTITGAAAGGTPSPGPASASPSSTILFDEPEPTPRSLSGVIVVTVALLVLLLIVIAGLAMWSRRRRG